MGDQRQILDAFFRHTQTCLVLLDREFNFVRVNDAYARACARAPEAFVGENHFELYPSPLIEDFRRVVADKQAWSTSARPFVFPDHPEWGTTHWDLALVPILDEAGEVEYLVFSLHDVTQIIRAEAALRASETRLRQAQKLEAIGRLAGGIAHDFNNLLSVINSYTALSLGRLEANSSIRADLSEVLAAGERAAALTRQLLAFSRSQVLTPRPLSLPEVLSGIEGMLRRVIGENVELRVTVEGPVDEIMADAGQLELVVMNLVVNARDAMPDGGTIEISVSNAETREGVDDGHDLPPGRYVQLSVRDTGRGMDEATLARLFEPFFTTKPLGRGTGLGLATVLGIVQQSRGSIAVRSDPGAGSTFEVRFVSHGPAAASTPPPTPEPRKTAGSETILVVEDADAVRDILVRILRTAGYRVLSASNGGDALDLLKTEPVDLVVTDVIMPRMGGPELVQKLGEQHPGLRSIFISGYVDDAAALSTEIEAGTHFLAKPVMPEVLLHKIRSILDAA